MYFYNINKIVKKLIFKLNTKNFFIHSLLLLNNFKQIVIFKYLKDKNINIKHLYKVNVLVY